MDTKAYLRMFRTQSEQLRGLAEHLAAHVAQMEQGLQERAPSAEARPQIDGFIQCSAQIAETADILHQRLVAFRKEAQGDQAPVPPYDPSVPQAA
jgi:hypothetical protein